MDLMMMQVVCVYGLKMRLMDLLKKLQEIGKNLRRRGWGGFGRMHPKPFCVIDVNILIPCKSLGNHRGQMNLYYVMIYICITRQYYRMICMYMFNLDDMYIWINMIYAWYVIYRLTEVIIYMIYKSRRYKEL